MEVAKHSHIRYTPTRITCIHGMLLFESVYICMKQTPIDIRQTVRLMRLMIYTL